MYKIRVKGHVAAKEINTIKKKPATLYREKKKDTLTVSQTQQEYWALYAQ